MMLEEKEFDGTYVIGDNGKTLLKDENTILNPEYNGTGIESGVLEIKDGKVVNIVNGKINNYYVKIINDIVKIYKKIPESKLKTGKQFSESIKTLANGTIVNFDYDDSIVTRIEFLSDGRLPDGYTKEKLLELKNVDVSENNDKSVLALYDGNGTIYIYSDLLIKANPDSSYMFNNFKNILNIEITDLNTSECTNMMRMFVNCGMLTNLDMSNFNTNNVTDMGYLFSGCKSLKELNVRNFNTSKVTNMEFIFCDLSSITELDISNFDTGNVINMQYMFYGMSSLTNLDVRNLKTNKVTNMKHMFHSVSKVTKLDLSNFDTGNVTEMAGMFTLMEKLESLDLSNFNTSNVTRMDGMFTHNISLSALNVSNFDTSKVTNMSNMFQNCQNISSLDLSSFNTSSVTNMYYMFYNNIKLKKLNMSKADFIKVSNYGSMLNGVADGIEILVKNINAQNFIQNRLTDAVKTGNIIVSN